MTTEHNEARQFIVAAYLALEKITGKGSVGKARAAARAAGFSFDTADAGKWLAGFVKQAEETRRGPRGRFVTSGPKSDQRKDRPADRRLSTIQTVSETGDQTNLGPTRVKGTSSTNTEFTSEHSAATDVATTCSSVPASQNAAEVEQPALIPDLIAVGTSARKSPRTRSQASGAEPDRRRNAPWALAEWLYDQAVARGVLDSGRADRSDAIRARAVRRDLRAAKDLLESFSLEAIRARAEVLIDLRVAGKRRDVPTCRKLLSAWNDVDVVREIEADAAIPPPITMGVTAADLEPYERAARAVSYLHRAPTRDLARDRERPPVTPEQRARAREIMRRKAPCVGGPAARSIA